MNSKANLGAMGGGSGKLVFRRRAGGEMDLNGGMNGMDDGCPQVIILESIRKQVQIYHVTNAETTSIGCGHI